MSYEDRLKESDDMMLHQVTDAVKDLGKSVANRFKDIKIFKRG